VLASRTVPAPARSAPAAAGAGAIAQGGAGGRRGGSGGTSRRGEGSQPAVRRYRTERRSPARATLLILGGLIVGVAVLVFALVSLGGSSKGGSSSASQTASSASSSAEQAPAEGSKTSSGSSSKAASATVNPSQTNVVVLNGTGTTGLAHRVSGELTQHGFSRAAPLNGRPPGTNQATVVEYAGGHRADAQGVARALGVTQAQPMEGTVASLAGSATVVVIVGLDKAATVP
jgi:uncharacterized membrane protein YeiB